jgi:hypothetical protein
MSRLIPSLFLACGLAAAQTAPQVITASMKRGREIVDQAVEALGGARFLAIRTRVEKGRMYSFFRQELSGLSKATVYTRYQPLPDSPDPDTVYMVERQAYGDDEKWSVLFAEDDAWEITFRGARPIKQETIERYRESRRRDIFYILLRRLQEPGMIFEHRGREVVDNFPLEKVDITDAGNRVVTVWFHYSTKLPMRQQFTLRDKNRIPHEELTIYDAYRDSGGGAKLPWIVQRFRDGEKAFAMFSSSVEANPPVPEDKFALPIEIKMLERQK